MQSRSVVSFRRTCGAAPSLPVIRRGTSIRVVEYTASAEPRGAHGSHEAVKAIEVGHQPPLLPLDSASSAMASDAEVGDVEGG